MICLNKAVKGCILISRCLVRLVCTGRKAEKAGASTGPEGFTLCSLVSGRAGCGLEADITFSD